jgi:TRAP-type uncharacterized transport system substrate-binding protein
LKKIIVILTAVVIAAVIAGVAYYSMKVSAPVRKEIRMGGGTPGSTGYVIGSLIADVARDVLPECDFSFYALGGIAACTKEFIAGGLELAYSSNTELGAFYRRQIWYKDKKREDIKVEPTHTVYIFSTSGILVTTPELKEKYKLNSWRDLDGKRACYFSTKFGPYYYLTMALDALGVRWHHVEMDLDLVGDALKKGDIVAAYLSMTGGVPAPWVIGLLTKVKVVIIPPSPDEVEIIKKSGLPFAWFSTERWKEAGVDVLGLDKTFGVVDYLGFTTSPRYMSGDEVYRLLKALVERKETLVKMTAYFKEFAADPIGFQVKAISIAPDVPVHPGLAKLLKEYGAWNEAWRIASE